MQLLIKQSVICNSPSLSPKPACRLRDGEYNQARSRGGGGVGGGGGSVGSDDPPPQLPIPKILFHPLAILFHPLAILFHPWNMWMSSHGQCPRGGACECPRVGAFFKLMTSRGQCPRGGGLRLVFHPSKFRPPPTWLAGYGPDNRSIIVSTTFIPLAEWIINRCNISM